MQKDFGGLMTMMAANTEVFSRVPAGLAHCKPLVDTMETNVDNYGQVSSLPNFNLFTFFFMVSGALLAILAGIGLFAGRERRVTGVKPTPTPFTETAARRPARGAGPVVAGCRTFLCAGSNPRPASGGLGPGAGIRERREGRLDLRSKVLERGREDE